MKPKLGLGLAFFTLLALAVGACGPGATPPPITFGVILVGP